MEVASFVLAAVALGVGAASLGWNVLNYLLTGQRAALDVTPMRLIATPNVQELEPVLQVTVKATGRVPIEVTGWNVAMPGELNLHSAVVAMQYGGMTDLHLGDDLPKMIQPGSSAAFNIPRVALEKAAEAYNVDLKQAHIHVYFGARKSLVDKVSVAERMGG